jgi:hypothetical protein
MLEKEPKMRNGRIDTKFLQNIFLVYHMDILPQIVCVALKLSNQSVAQIGADSRSYKLAKPWWEVCLKGLFLNWSNSSHFPPKTNSAC